MAKEIERKFLVEGEGWRRAAAEPRSITQAYLIHARDRSLRVRRYGDGRAQLTLKIGAAGAVRDEFEYDIPDADAAEMMAHLIGRPVRKVRHHIRSDGLIWEVDEFKGHLDGLVVAEVELSSADEQPRLPAWIGREVTGEEAFQNASLAICGLPARTKPSPLSS